MGISLERPKNWAEFSLGRMPRVSTALCASLAFVLGGCTPVVDVAFYNATGQPIVVRNDASPGFEASIPAGASAPVDVLVLRPGYPNEFTITTPNHAWVYQHRLRLLSSVSREHWENGPFDSKRLHVRVDSRGNIYLLSSSGSPISQPAGFPIHPDGQKKT
jgi:hypothetical protein